MPHRSLKRIRTTGLLYVLLICIVNLSMAQDALKPVDGSSFSYLGSDEVDGSPYVFESFEKSKLIGTNGSVTEDVMINYNAEIDQMIAKTSETNYLLLSSYMYRDIICPSGNYRNMNTVGQKGYARIIYEGEDLALFEKTIAHRTKPDSNPYSDIKANYRIRHIQRYYLNVKEELHEIKLKEKSFYDHFPKEEVKKIFKQNDLKLKNEADLVKFLRLLDSRY